MSKSNRYGLPYMGSKSKIAKAIVDSLPPRKHFVDLFCGGCAITHCAMLSGKWEDYAINDINPMIVDLFLNACKGKYKDERRWISHEDFDRLKTTDPYVAYVWSFGNNPLKGYMYSRDIEPWKKALHHARVLGDRSLLKEMGIEGSCTRLDILAHAEEYQAKYNAWLKKEGIDSNAQSKSLEMLQSLLSLGRLERLQNLERLERLGSLGSLGSLEKRVKPSVGDYSNVKIEENSLIYCDIPYEGTEAYSKDDFDHRRFYDWACEQTEPIIISSYEISDNRFVRLFDIEKKSILCATDNATTKHEGLFVPKSQLVWWKGHSFLSEDCYKEQLTLF